MKLYFSGTLGRDIDEYFYSLGVCRLFSAAYRNELFANLRMLQSNNTDGYDLIIDSGAFTAWNAGKAMTIDNMLNVWNEILDRYPQHNYTFISLDVIPGVKGQEKTLDDYDYAEKQSIDNYHTLVDKYPTLKILPVYHAPEPLRVLRHYMKHTKHIAISVNATLSEKERVSVLQNIFPHDIKVHGLATTGLKMLRCVDWYSVDSATWAMIGAMGGLLWLNESHTGFLKIPVSIESPRRKMHGSHIDTSFSADMVYDKIQEYGFDVDLLRVDYKERAKWNILMWHNLRIQHIENKQEGLFEL